MLRLICSFICNPPSLPLSWRPLFASSSYLRFHSLSARTEIKVHSNLNRFVVLETHPNLFGIMSLLRRKTKRSFFYCINHFIMIYYRLTVAPCCGNITFLYFEGFSPWNVFNLACLFRISLCHHSYAVLSFF